MSLRGLKKRAVSDKLLVELNFGSDLQGRQTNSGLKKADRLLIFGDAHGCPALLQHISRDKIVGVVAAGNRPDSHEPVQKLCKELALPFILQPKFSQTDVYKRFIEDVSKLKPDLIFVYSYAMLLREDLLRIPSNGGVNIHAGTLPEYRGSNPIQWEILNQEDWAGVSLHKLENTIDSGIVYASKKAPILFSDTWVDVMEKVSSAAKEILKENINSLLDGAAEGVPQDETKAVIRKRRTPEDGRFEWGMPSIHIYNLIRALVSPLPGAFVVEPSGKRIEFNQFNPMAKVLALKSKVHPFRFDKLTIEANLEKSSKEGVCLILKDSSNKIVSEVYVTKLLKHEAVVQCSSIYEKVLRDFCAKEFEVNTLHFVS